MTKRQNKKTTFFYVMVIIVLITAIIAVGITAYKGDDKLRETKSLTEQNFSDKKVIAIDTKYGNLYYPVKWEEKIIIKVHDKDVYKVSFYGRIAENDSQHLFDVAFGGEEGDLIGELEFQSMKVPVYIIGSDIKEKEGWDENEVMTLREMQEDVNCIVNMMQKEDNFTSID